MGRRLCALRLRSSLGYGLQPEVSPAEVARAADLDEKELLDRIARSDARELELMDRVAELEAELVSEKAMNAKEKAALTLRARAYMIGLAGYTAFQVDLTQAGNQAWRHMYQFARREIERERRRARNAKGAKR